MGQLKAVWMSFSSALKLVRDYSNTEYCQVFSRSVWF